jgi:hypothetical protein
LSAAWYLLVFQSSLLWPKFLGSVGAGVQRPQEGLCGVCAEEQQEAVWSAYIADKEFLLEMLGVSAGWGRTFHGHGCLLAASKCQPVMANLLLRLQESNSPLSELPPSAGLGLPALVR